MGLGKAAALQSAWPLPPDVHGLEIDASVGRLTYGWVGAVSARSEEHHEDIAVRTDLLSVALTRILAAKAVPSRGRLELAAKTLCLLYVGVLYWLLLTSGPRMLLRARVDAFLPWHDVLAVGHLLCFTLLAALAFLSRRKMPPWAVLLLLVIAAVGTEFLQGWVPMRTPEMADCLQNLAGIALGGGLYWAAARLLRPDTLQYTG